MCGWRTRETFVSNLALLLVLTVTVGSESVHVSPTVAYATDGEPVNLTCHHPFNPNATVLWEKETDDGRKGTSIDTDSTIMVSGPVLQILHFNVSLHAGQYSCSVEERPQKERITSCPSDVLLAYSDFQHIIQPADVTAYAGATVVFHCNVILSVPRVQTTWTHNEQPIDALTDNGVALMPSGNLYISSVDSSRRGSYQCIATNPVTMDHWRSTEATLIVLERTGNETDTVPSFVVEPKDTVAMERSTVVLECAGQGYPQPTVTWEKTGSNKLPGSASVHSTGALIITNVSMSDLGTYVCKLGDNSTAGFQLQKQVNLTVIGNPDFEQAFAFSESDVNGRSGVACVSRASSLLEGDCQQKLYLLYNGSVIDQNIGDSIASITHFFKESSNMTTNRLFQCLSVTPGGCAIVDVQVNYVDGIITDETIITYPVSNIPTSAACLVSTNIPPTTTTNLPDNLSTTEPPTTSLCESTLQGGMEPSLKVNIPSSVTFASLGSAVVSTCEVSGPGSGSVHVTWLFNGTRDILAQPLESVVVNLRSMMDGSVARITANLTIESIDYGHTGSYTCSAHSDCPSMHASSAIFISVKPPESSTAPDISAGDTTTEPVQSTILGTDEASTAPDTSTGETTPEPIQFTISGTDEASTAHDTSTGETTPEPVQSTISGTDETSTAPDTSTGETTPEPVQSTISGTDEASMAATGSLSTLGVPRTEATTLSTTDRVDTDTSPTVIMSRPKPSFRPTHLNVSVIPTTRDIHVRWDYPDAASVRGFKINWDTADRVSVSARQVVDRDVFHFIILSSLYDHTLELVVHVWAYNNYGDGPHSAITISSFEGTSTSSSSVAITEVTSDYLTSGTSMRTILECTAATRSPTTVELSWPGFLGANDSSVLLITSCEEGNTQLSTLISSSIPPYLINQALPSCSYTFELQFMRHIAACAVVTPNGQVDIKANVTRLPNGSVALQYHLPPELSDDSELRVEVNWGEGWFPLSESHIPSYFDSSKEHQVELRLRLGMWEGHVNITVPSVATTEAGEEEGESITDTILLYCIIFATLLITCAILLAIILGLKHVQWSHRESDKVTDFREKSRQKRQKLFRDRAERSSIKSDISDNSTAV